MNIQPIVEGHGEVGAVPVLLRRLRDEAAAYRLEVNPPIRKPRSQLTNEQKLRTAVSLARMQEDCACILILIDSDDDCPAEKGQEIQGWAEDEANPIPCAVVLACREYEAWFLATIESLRGTRGIRDDAESHLDPETTRDAKGQVEKRMAPRRSYSESADQPALTARFDMAQAYRRCRSFRRMAEVFGRLAAQLGFEIGTWPPPVWMEEE